jgi:hypothetical protein
MATSEREAFEAWAGEMEMYLGRNDSDHYRDYSTRLVWAAWQARSRTAAREEPSAAGVREALAKFGRHLPLCAAVGGYDIGCDCGFDRALAQQDADK